MNADNRSLESIFNQPISKTEFLMGNERGLKITFSEHADFGKFWFFAPKFFDNPEFHKLVDDAGVIILSNASLNLIRNRSFVALNNKQGGIRSAPFHRDIFPDNPQSNNKTALYLSRGKSRETPTFFAEIDEVKQAIKKYLKSDKAKRLPDAFKGALTNAAKADFTFSFTGEEFNILEIFQEHCPSATQEIFDLIPSDKKHAHYWNTPQESLVIYSNINILHARPASNERSAPQLKIYEIQSTKPSHP